MPEELKLRCNRIRELAITSTCLYEVFKVDKYWRRKLTYGKEVVGEQLRGMATVIDNLAAEFSFSLDGCLTGCSGQAEAQTGGAAGKRDYSYRIRQSQRDICIYEGLPWRAGLPL
jgi:hypothetical protein